MECPLTVSNKTRFGIMDILGSPDSSTKICVVRTDGTAPAKHKDFHDAYADGKPGYQDDCSSVISDETYGSNSSDISSHRSDRKITGGDEKGTICPKIIFLSRHSR